MFLNAKEWFIEAPWGRISIVAWGSCLDPPLLLCHGSMDCSASFQPLINLLPQNFYYVGLDLPGCGRSDPFPPGLMINSFDMLHALVTVVNHFRWDSFIFMGHSLGTILGTLYNLSYPNKISKVIELDPTAKYYNVAPDEFSSWYHQYFTTFYNKYEKLNAPRETAPSYTRDKAIAMLKDVRCLPEDVATLILDRISEPVENGRVRFTFDQRVKIITKLPLSTEQQERLFTAIPTPTLAIIADISLKAGFYDRSPFALDEAAFPKRNYRVKKVPGSHDVHIIEPELVAPLVETFLLFDLEGLDKRSKL